MLYTTLKFVHVVAAIVWLGGVVMLALVNARAATSSEPGLGPAMTQASNSLGQQVIGPAAGLTLLAGFATAIAGDISMGSPWIIWGFAGLLVSGLLGGTVLRRTGQELATAQARLAGEHVEDPAAVQRLQLRMRTLTIVNVVVLFSAVWAMVAKPG